MFRLSLIILCILLTGCGDPSDKAPLLTLKVERENGMSNRIGRYRVFATGVLSESGDGSSHAKTTHQKVTLVKIADGGVTLIFEASDSLGMDITTELVVPYGQETRVELPGGATLVASLQARK